MNATREAIVVIYQKADRELVQARLPTLQNDISALIAPGEAANFHFGDQWTNLQAPHQDPGRSNYTKSTY